MDKEKILLAAKMCAESAGCSECPLCGRFICRYVFAKFISNNFSDTNPDPLLTRWDAEKPPEKIDIEYILDTAKRMVTRKPEDNFKLIGRFWGLILDREITPETVVIMMGVIKMTRIQTGTATIDDWIDLVGYAACGGEIACKQKVIEVEV